MTLIRFASIACVCLLQSLVFFTTALGQGLPPADRAEATHYDIRARLLPEAGSLDVRVGDDRFTAFLRMLLTRETGTIEDMLGVLETVTDEETAAWFESKL